MEYKGWFIRVMEKPQTNGNILYEPSIHELPNSPSNEPKDNLLLNYHFKRIEEAQIYAKWFINTRINV